MVAYEHSWPASTVIAGAMLGRYQVLSQMATGGMAEIYLARTVGIEGFERYVVIKCIKPEYSRDMQFVQMFLDEARISAQLHHHNIAHVFDIGQAPETGAPYFAMEYVHGQNVLAVLQQAARSGELVPIEHAIAILLGACAGLHYAHDKRSPDLRPLDIVHRDISPSNVIVTYDGAVKVVDFGIAKATVRATETRTGIVKGKLAYMSPEQLRNEPTVDRRADIFALGVLLYELTTSTPAFAADNDYATMTKIVHADIDPPSMKRAGYPLELEAIVMRCLATKPASRYPTAAALIEDLVAFCKRAGLAPSTLGLEGYMRELFGTRPEPWLGLSFPPPSVVTGELASSWSSLRPSRRRVWFGVAGIAAAGVAAFLLAMHSGPSVEASPAPTPPPAVVTMPLAPSPPPPSPPPPTPPPIAMPVIDEPAAPPKRAAKRVRVKPPVKRALRDVNSLVPPD